MPVKLKKVNSAPEWEELKKNGKTLVIDFTASWCGPCQMIGPVFEEFSDDKTNPGYSSLMFLKIDVDECSDIAGEAGIRAMPTFQIWKGGKKVKEMVGANKDGLKKLLDDALKA